MPGDSIVVLEPHVEQALVPEELGVVREGRAGDVGRARLRRSRSCRSEGSETRAATIRASSEASIAFVELDLVRDPEPGRVPQGSVRACEVQVARAAGRVVHVAHGGEGHAHEQMQALPLGLEEGLHRHVARDVVGGRGGHGRERRDAAMPRGRRRLTERPQAYRVTLRLASIGRAIPRQCILAAVTFQPKRA